ncbi:unnamed protein product, partial [Owenia fusiformis]
MAEKARGSQSPILLDVTSLGGSSEDESIARGVSPPVGSPDATKKLLTNQESPQHVLPPFRKCHSSGEFKLTADTTDKNKLQTTGSFVMNGNMIHSSSDNAAICPSMNCPRRIPMLEITPSTASFLDDLPDDKEEAKNDQWRMSLDVFTSKRRGKQKADKKLPQSVRAYYKAQDELITNFELAHQDSFNEEESDERKKKVLRMANILAKTSLFLNLLLLIGKVVAAVISGSLSVISSVIDSAVDMASGVIIWWTSRAMKQRNPYLYPQGRTKLEPVAIIVISVVMALASVQMIRESIQKIIEYAGDQSSGPSVDIATIVILSFTIVTKLVLFLVCRRIANPSIQTLAQDHRNDVLSNLVALAMGFIGTRYWSYADPIGAVLISIYIIVSWSLTGWDQIKLLTGHTARPDLLKKITWICVNHHKSIEMIESVMAYHFGNNFLVEVDIVLPPKMTLEEAHDIGEPLQRKIEMLEEVERAFV